jgi:hypothetical protein
MPNLIFYFTAIWQARSPMTDFLIDCNFNSFCKGKKNFVSTPRYAKKLLAMRHSTESRLRAMPPSVKFKSNIFLPTPCYAAQREVDSALCRIAQSCDSALYHIAQSIATQHGVDFHRRIESNYSANSNLNAKPFLPMNQGTQGTVDEKNQRSKIS